MPRNWEQDYHQKIHRQKVKKVKGHGLGAGAKGVYGKPLSKKGIQGSFQEQSDALQASLEASSALIVQLKEKVGMTDEQKEALVELEENAEQLGELLGPNAVRAKIEKAELAIASLREETRRLQQQMEVQAATQKMATPRAAPDDLEEWLSSFGVDIEEIGDQLAELGVSCPMDLLELDPEDIANLKKPLKKVPQRKFEKALAEIGARDSLSAEGRVIASKSPQRKLAADSGGWDVTPSKAQEAVSAAAVRKREASRKREEQREWKMDQERKRKNRLMEGQQTVAFTSAAEAQRKREGMAAKEIERKERVKEQRAKERARREAARVTVQEDKEKQRVAKLEEAARRKEEQKRRKEEKAKARDEEEALRKKIEALERKKEQRAAAKRKAQADARRNPKPTPKKELARAIEDTPTPRKAKPSPGKSSLAKSTPAKSPAKATPAKSTARSGKSSARSTGGNTARDQKAREEEMKRQIQAEEQAAATKVQAYHRGRLARQELEEQQWAATRVQAIQRGRMSRAERHAVAEALRAEAEALEAAAEEEEELEPAPKEREPKPWEKKKKAPKPWEKKPARAAVSIKAIPITTCFPGKSLTTDCLCLQAPVEPDPEPEPPVAPVSPVKADESGLKPWEKKKKPKPWEKQGPDRVNTQANPPQLEFQGRF